MGEKVKISREQAEAIEWIKNDEKYADNLSIAVEDHVHCPREWYGTSYAVNDMPLQDFIRALYIGYEVTEVFEVGDWVIVSGQEGAFQVEEEVSGLYMLDGIFEYVHPKHMSFATAKEIKMGKDRQAWAKIGREVADFKKGDVIIAGKTPLKITTKESPEKSSCSVGHAQIAYDAKHIIGFYPAESFISFGGGEE